MTDRDRRDAEESFADAMQEFGEAFGDAMQQMGSSLADGLRQASDALSEADFSGVAKKISKGGSDFARAIADLGSDSSSPYIIEDTRIARSGWAQQLAAVALLVFLSIPLIAVGIIFGALFRSLIVAVLLFALCAASTALALRLMGRGKAARRFSSVMDRVRDSLGTRESVPVAELARKVGRPAPELTGILGEAIRQGLIPEGRIAETSSGPTLFLTDEAWMASEESWSAFPTAGGQDAPTVVVEEGESLDGLPEGARESIRAALASIDEIRESALWTKDLEVRTSLESIASRAEGIVAYVADHPETSDQFRKAATYYLPTTAKMAASCVELERHSSGPKVAATLSELRATLAKVDEALARLSDELVLGQSIDLKSEMDVLRMTLRQDGLSDQGDFSTGERRRD